MKKVLAVLVSLSLILVAATAMADEVTYDLAEYMELTPGQWVTQTDQNGNEYRVVTSSSGGLLVREGYAIVSGAQQLVHKWIMSYTDSSIFFHGDYTLVLGDATYNPAIVLPRNMAAGDAVLHQGEKQAEIVGCGTFTTPNYVIIYLDEGGITVTTDAGTFTDCIRLVMTELDHDSSITNIFYYAKGVGVVKHHQAGTYESGADIVTATATMTTTDYGSGGLIIR